MNTFFYLYNAGLVFSDSLPYENIEIRQFFHYLTFFMQMPIRLNHQTVYMKIKQFIEIINFITKYFKILRFGVFLDEKCNNSSSWVLWGPKRPRT